jgi:hypothetical protein
VPGFHSARTGLIILTTPAGRPAVLSLPPEPLKQALVKETRESQPLEYEKPPERRRDSAWSLVGFALALMLASFAGLLWRDLWRSRGGGGGRMTSFGVTPVYYFLVAAVAAVCVRGLIAGRKRFALAGLALALASFVVVVVIVRGSPW